MNGANEKLASFADDVAKNPDNNQVFSHYINQSNSFEAVIKCAKFAKVITQVQFANLNTIQWSEENTDVNFSGFVGVNSRRVTGPEEFYEVPRGAFVAFIELDKAETFSIPGGDSAQKRKLIHAMISLGEGRFVGMNNRKAIAQGNDGKWEILDDLHTRFRLRWTKERLNIAPVGLPPRNVRVRYRLVDEILDPRIAKDIEQLAQHFKSAPPGSVLRLILGDAIRASDLLPNSQDWTFYSPPPPPPDRPVGGSANVSYDRATHKRKRYVVEYTAGNIGNLVHELTHVLVNEAYNRDFVNYTTKSKAIPGPVYNSDGFRMNQESRQDKWLDVSASLQRAKRVNELETLALNIQFSNRSESVEAFREKLIQKGQFNYARTKAHLEYDTVLNQFLVWMHIDWKLAQAPEAKAFMDSLEKACTEARDQREEALKNQATTGL